MLLVLYIRVSSGFGSFLGISSNQTDKPAKTGHSRFVGFENRSGSFDFAGYIGSGFQFYF